MGTADAQESASALSVAPPSVGVAAGGQGQAGLTLTSLCDEPTLFKIRASCPARFSARPCMGIVPPRGAASVAVQMRGEGVPSHADRYEVCWRTLTATEAAGVALYAQGWYSQGAALLGLPDSTTAQELFRKLWGPSPPEGSIVVPCVSPAAAEQTREPPQPESGVSAPQPLPAQQPSLALTELTAELPIGAEVVAHGLLNDVRLNGARGRVVGYQRGAPNLAQGDGALLQVDFSPVRPVPIAISPLNVRPAPPVLSPAAAERSGGLATPLPLPAPGGGSGPGRSPARTVDSRGQSAGGFSHSTSGPRPPQHAPAPAAAAAWLRPAADETAPVTAAWHRAASGAVEERAPGPAPDQEAVERPTSAAPPPSAASRSCDGGSPAEPAAVEACFGDPVPEPMSGSIPDPEPQPEGTPTHPAPPVALPSAAPSAPRGDARRDPCAATYSAPLGAEGPRRPAPVVRWSAPAAGLQRLPTVPTVGGVALTAAAGASLPRPPLTPPAAPPRDPPAPAAGSERGAAPPAEGAADQPVFETAVPEAAAGEAPPGAVQAAAGEAPAVAAVRPAPHHSAAAAEPGRADRPPPRAAVPLSAPPPTPTPAVCCTPRPWEPPIRVLPPAPAPGPCGAWSCGSSAPRAAGGSGERSLSTAPRALELVASGSQSRQDVVEALVTGALQAEARIERLVASVLELAPQLRHPGPPS